MNYISKTYSLSEDVVARLDALREKYGSVNKALTTVLPIAADAVSAALEPEVPQRPTPAQPPRETGSQRAERERRERQQRARGQDSIDDVSIDRSDEFVSG